MTVFKPGDRVCCIDAYPPLVDRQVYTVARLSNQADTLQVDDSSGWWGHFRFELAPEFELAVSASTYEQRVRAFELAALMTDPRNDSYRYSPSEVLGFLLGDKTL